jgi:hypothetical protein
MRLESALAALVPYMVLAILILEILHLFFGLGK